MRRACAGVTGEVIGAPGTSAAVPLENLTSNALGNALAAFANDWCSFVDALTLKYIVARCSAPHEDGLDKCSPHFD